MNSGKCPRHCCTRNCVSRRDFLRGSTTLPTGASVPAGFASQGQPRAQVAPIRQSGPAAKYRPVLRAAFVRRQGEYGIRWPGADYDGEAALRMYAAKISDTASQLGTEMELRPKPIYSLAEGESWLA